MAKSSVSQRLAFLMLQRPSGHSNVWVRVLKATSQRDDHSGASLQIFGFGKGLGRSVKQAIANSEQGLNAKFAGACHAAPDGPRKHLIFAYSRQTTWLETTNPERVNIEETA